MAALKTKQLPYGTACSVGTVLRAWGDSRLVLVYAVEANCPQPRQEAPNYTELMCIPLGRIRKGVVTPAKRRRAFPLAQLPGDNPRPLHMGMVEGCAYRIVQLLAK